MSPGESIDPEPPRVEAAGERAPVLETLWFFLAAVAAVGPFALPLLWRNPRYSKATKIWGSLAVVAFTVALIWASGAMLGRILEQVQALKGSGAL